MNKDKPVLAKMKDAEKGSFRVITGYDGEMLICPDFSTASNAPDQFPTYEDVECLYVIGDQISPKYTFIDALKRIKRVMERQMLF